MKQILLLAFAALLLSCSETNPVEDAFTAYMMKTLDDPGSYEFVKVDHSLPVHVTYDEYLEVVVPSRRRIAVKDSLYSIKTGPVRYYDAFVTFRAKNRLGALIKQRMYIQVQEGKVIGAKNWNEELPEDRRD